MKLCTIQSAILDKIVGETIHSEIMKAAGIFHSNRTILVPVELIKNMIYNAKLNNHSHTMDKIKYP